jgi:L-alanine-DL-glutamate epimerase-like enolase superfamily enzyme
MFDSVLANPMKPMGGWLAPREEPGFGVELNESEIERYRIA